MKLNAQSPAKINGTIYILSYGWGHQTSGGEEVQSGHLRTTGEGKSKFCGRLLWMDPVENSYIEQAL